MPLSILFSSRANGLTNLNGIHRITLSILFSSSDEAVTDIEAVCETIFQSSFHRGGCVLKIEGSGIMVTFNPLFIEHSGTSLSPSRMV